MDKYVVTERDSVFGLHRENKYSNIQQEMKNRIYLREAKGSK